MDGDKPQFSRGDVIAGKYEVEKVLGSGLIGTTYLVRNQKSRKFLAVKVIWPQLVTSEHVSPNETLTRLVSHSCDTDRRESDIVGACLTSFIRRR